MERQNNRGESLQRVILTGNVEISPKVHWISWKREEDFLPGQVVRIALSPGELPRIYSICSGNRDADLSILFNVREEGSLTPRLAALRPGDPLYVSGPYGSFTGDAEPAWWIATGTGIAPYYSMFRSGLAGNNKLIHGARYASQFYFGDQFAQHLGDRYVRCCSQEEIPGLFHGRVTRYLEQVETFPAGVKYYLCGSALMVVEVRDFLIGRGISWNHIIAEIYF